MKGGSGKERERNKGIKKARKEGRKGGRKEGKKEKREGRKLKKKMGEGSGKKGCNCILHVDKKEEEVRAEEVKGSMNKISQGQ